MRSTKNITGKKLPLTDLAAEYQKIKKEVDKATSRVLQKGWFILGEEVRQFEKGLASYVGTKYAVGVASGTDALTLAVKTLELGGKDGVIVPANVYPTAFGIALSGVKLELADVDPDTLNISVETLKRAVKPDTRAIVVVHLYGNPADVSSIQKFCKKRGLYLIEDCAQAVGAKYKGEKVGTFGDISCFSFYPTKNLAAYGDGGAILTNDKEYARKAKMLRMYGEEERYESKILGHNSRLDELQAAILRVKLKHLEEWNKKRRVLAQIYKNALKDLPPLDGVASSAGPIKIIEETRDGKSVYHLFVVQIPEREKLKAYLEQNGIGTGVHYPIPIHLTPTFSGLGFKRGDFPVAEKASREVLSLPIYPSMTKQDVEFIAGRIREYFR